MLVEAAYVLPLRWTEDRGLDELTVYLGQVGSQVAELIVVDGSPDPLYSTHARALPDGARHLRPDPALGDLGKVAGVITGVRAATRDRVVIADDDVRYDASALQRICARLDDVELVRPQNRFEPLPWHARWDTARTLINRAWSGDPELGPGDFPGTLAVRRHAFLASGAYDGHSLFENLELIRTILAAGGRVATELDLVVARRPPTATHFASQRVRQAYDDFAIPRRLAASLAILPGLALAARRRHGRIYAAAAAAGAIAVAESGRRRGLGRRAYPATAALMAPLWVAERSICSWLAVGARMRGGVRWGHRRVWQAANSTATLRSRNGGRPARS